MPFDEVIGSTNLCRLNVNRVVFLAGQHNNWHSTATCYCFTEKIKARTGTKTIVEHTHIVLVLSQRSQPSVIGLYPVKDKSASFNHSQQIPSNEIIVFIILNKENFDNFSCHLDPFFSWELRVWTRRSTAH